MRVAGGRQYSSGGGKECNLQGLFAKQFAVGTEADELQHLVVGLAVNQQQVRFNVAFAVLSPIAGQTVVAITQR